MSRVLRLTRGRVVPAISLSADDATITVADGGSSVTINLTIARTNYTGTITLAVSGLPSGVTGTFSDSTITGAETSSVLTVSASGAAAVTDAAFTITASGSGVTDATVAGTCTVTTSAPTPSGTILFDMRAGGAESFQGTSDIVAAKAAVVAGPGISGLEFLGEGGNQAQNSSLLPTRSFLDTNIDGSNTRAFRFDLPGGTGNNSLGFGLMPYLQDTSRTEIYLKYKFRMGKTATSGGIGSVDTFQITNDNVAGNAAMKFLLAVREAGGDQRLDIIIAGDSTAGGGTPRGVQFEISNPTQFAGALANIDRTTLNPKNYIGQTVDVVVRLKAASTQSAADGVWQMWWNGTQVQNRSDLQLSQKGFNRFEFFSVINNPAIDQSIFIWDIVGWTP